MRTREGVPGKDTMSGTPIRRRGPLLYLASRGRGKAVGGTLGFRRLAHFFRLKGWGPDVPRPTNQREETGDEGHDEQDNHVKVSIFPKKAGDRIRVNDDRAER